MMRAAGASCAFVGVQFKGKRWCFSSMMDIFMIRIPRLACGIGYFFIDDSWACFHNKIWLRKIIFTELVKIIHEKNEI